MYVFYALYASNVRERAKPLGKSLTSHYNTSIFFRDIFPHNGLLSAYFSIEKMDNPLSYSFSPVLFYWHSIGKTEYMGTKIE